jgi:hypothetical protein
LPDGTQVLTGTYSDDDEVSGHYLIDRDLTRSPRWTSPPNPNRDVNFSASKIIGGG